MLSDARIVNIGNNTKVISLVNVKYTKDIIVPGIGSVLKVSERNDISLKGQLKGIQSWKIKK